MNRLYSSLFARLLANSIEDEDGCWCWTGRRTRRGYGMVSVRIPGRPHPVAQRAHRVMARVVLGRELHPDLETIEHSCEMPWCINPSHLAICTRAENTADMQARRNGRPRRRFRPLVDPDLYHVDRFVRSLPVLRETLHETEEIPS